MKTTQKEKILFNENVQLPDNSIELNKLERTLMETIVPRISTIKYLDDDTYKNLVDDILDIHYKVADLSMDVFAIKTQLEEAYFKKFKHTPELAKTLWQKEYHEYHKPYNVIKNKCFDYLDALEKKYIDQHGEKPMVHDKITTEYKY